MRCGQDGNIAAGAHPPSQVATWRIWPESGNRYQASFCVVAAGSLPRNPKSTGRKSKLLGLAAHAHLQANGGGLV